MGNYGISFPVTPADKVNTRWAGLGRRHEGGDVGCRRVVKGGWVGRRGVEMWGVEG